MSGKSMAEEGFLRRWSRLKSTGGGPEAQAPLPAAPPLPAVQAPAEAPPCAEAGIARPLPTLDDVAALSFESDYSGFVAQGVDKAVQRLALKKLFSDPHFKVMDGLDIYMEDFNKASPLAADMLAELRHADSALGRMLEDEEPDEEPDQAASEDGGEPAQELEQEFEQERERAPLAQAGNPQENPQGNA